MNSILITGASGLIGSELALFLSKNPLIELDNGDVFLYLVDKREPLYDVDNVENSTFILGDLTDEEFISSLPPVDGIIHLAAMSRVITSERNPYNAWETNVSATHRLLMKYSEKATKKVPWVIYGSSREIYGEPKYFPVDEGHSKFPINNYGVTKLTSERLVEEYAKRNGVAAISLRFSNVYGNLFDQMDRVIPKFILRALDDKPLELQGKANTFDFTNVKDTVYGIIKAIEKLQSLNNNDKPYYQAFNICTGKGTTLEQLANMIITLTNSNSELLEAPKRNFDVQRFFGDYSKAAAELSYSPKIDLYKGIERLVEEIKTNFLYLIERRRD